MLIVYLSFLSCVVYVYQVSVLRYAPHLDKCLGKGKTVRGNKRKEAPTSNGNGTPAGGIGGTPIAGLGAGAGGGVLGRKGLIGGLEGGAGLGTPPLAGGKSKGGRPRGKKTNKNTHPEFKRYIFTDDNMILRVKMENGGKSIIVRPSVLMTT